MAQYAPHPLTQPLTRNVQGPDQDVDMGGGLS